VSERNQRVPVGIVGPQYIKRTHTYTVVGRTCMQYMQCFHWEACSSWCDLSGSPTVIV